MIAYKGRSLAGYAWGKEGARSVLLVHGWRAQSGSMSAYVDPLVAAGYRVVAFDAPAHARSPGLQTDLTDYADAINTVIRQHGAFDAIIAHSLGGAATTLALHRYPDVSVETLVLISSPARLRSTLVGFSHALGLSSRATRALMSQVRDRMGQSVDVYSIEHMIGRLNVRGMIVHDRDDDTVPFSAAQAIVDHWPQGSLYETHGLGHRDVLRDSATVEAIVRFLNTQS